MTVTSGSFHSLRLAELDEVFIFELALARGVGDVREARTMRFRVRVLGEWLGGEE